MSKTIFEAMGDAGTLHAFVQYPANTFPGQKQEMKDNTHFNSYGAYELARAIVQSIRDQHLPLEPYLRPGIPPFDPAHPLPFADWSLPMSPFLTTTRPTGTNGFVSARASRPKRTWGAGRGCVRAWRAGRRSCRR